MTKSILFMKHRILAALLALAMILSLSACGNNTVDTKTTSLYAQGLEIIKLMSEMIHNEECVNIFAAGSSEIASVVQGISTGDYSEPKAVYAVSIADDNLAAMIELNSPDNTSDGLRLFLMQKMFGSLMIQINSMSGMAKVAAASVCTVEKTFVDENTTEDVIYLYTYENAVPVAVTFTIGENHAVSASGIFIMNDEFTCGSANEIKYFLGFIGVDVIEVFPED